MPSDRKTPGLGALQAFAWLCDLHRVTEPPGLCPPLEQGDRHRPPAGRQGTMPSPAHSSPVPTAAPAAGPPFPAQSQLACLCLRARVSLGRPCCSGDPASGTPGAVPAFGAVGSQPRPRPERCACSPHRGQPLADQGLQCFLPAARPARAPGGCFSMSLPVLVGADARGISGAHSHTVGIPPPTFQCHNSVRPPSPTLCCRPLPSTQELRHPTTYPRQQLQGPTTTSSIPN